MRSGDSIMLNKACTGKGGFSILEVLLAMLIFSYALLAFSSVSLSVIKGNKTSKFFTQGVLLAQKTIEDLRSWQNMDSGDDMLFGTSDDRQVDTNLVNCTAENDTYSDHDMFLHPDYFYPLNTDGTEGAVQTCSTSLVPSTNPIRTWTINDNQPVPGMKTVTVVVGWLELGSIQYVSLSTALQGE